MKKTKNASIILSSLSQKKLEQLLIEINNTPLYFRNSLNLPSYISFGNEIEVNGISVQSAEIVVGMFNDVHDLQGNNEWVAKEDETVDAEITAPILNDESDKWDLFYEMYEVLNGTRAQIAGNTSCHVHYGTHMINTPHKLSLLLKTLVVFEPIIYKFGYGEDDRPRDSICYRPERVNFSMMSTPKQVDRFVSILDNFNYKNPGLMRTFFRNFVAEGLCYRPGFNFRNFDFSKLEYGISFDEPSIDDHLEIRCNNGTLKAEIAQNDINLVAHIIRAVNESMIDEEYVEKEYEKYRRKRYNFMVPYMVIVDEKEGERYNRLLEGFNKIRLNKAMKLADMIFDTDIDKFYFLKQYLKLFDLPKEDVKDILKTKKL